ncbi:MAG: hypothetical protein ACK4RK_10680 [Gemmataceae bacterium]
MSQGRAWMTALLLGVLAGCMSGKPTRTTAWLDKLRHLGAGPNGADVVQIDVAVIERPVGDRFLNAELWANADEQIVALERKALLEDNGFRVAHIGIPPAPLQALLTSDVSCPNPRRLRLHAGNEAKVLIGPPRPNCRFALHTDRDCQDVELTNAQFALEIVPTLTDDGRTRLRFTPRLQHGQKSLLPLPAPDRSCWLWQEQRPTARYEELSWEIDLAPNEYVAIGARFDHPESLGYGGFVEDAGSPPVQRLLVLRTNRTLPSLPDISNSPLEADALPSRTPPLALQAATSVVRGSAD